MVSIKIGNAIPSPIPTMIKFDITLKPEASKLKMDNKKVPPPIINNPDKANNLYFPVSVINWPMIALAPTMLNVMDIMNMPDFVAEAPITPWINIGIYMIVPNMPAPSKKPKKLEIVKTPFLNK